jgi:metal-responsive CopG/Arc/MetJ family transcriptional regulator
MSKKTPKAARMEIRLPGALLIEVNKAAKIAGQTQAAFVRHALRAAVARGASKVLAGVA